jgi:Arylsulfotransferase (ASST)
MLSIRALILGPGLVVGLGLLAGSASALQVGPTCTPATLNSSAIKAGSVTVSPLSGSRDASPATQISFLGVPAAEISVISVTGTRSGVHTGRLAAYSQGNGASFLPAKPFSEGERVSVVARVRFGGNTQTILDQFAIAGEDPLTTTPETIHPGSASEIQSFHSRPDLQPPLVSVTASSPAVAAGDELTAPYGGPGEAGPMILDPAGGLVWFKALPRYTSATNFRVQEYEGKPVLTWWQGDISVHGFGRGEDMIADSSYTDIAHVHAGNGDAADLHEFQLTPSGTALITAYHPIVCNLSSVGGPSYSGVTDGVFQEVDVKTGLVMYEWTSLDHVGLDESYSSAKTSSTRWPFDFFHINSINLDPDGSLLISARNTWTVYELNAQSGQILWRLGGKKSSFHGAANTQTAWQHDPRELPGGQISLFDNGSSPTVHPQSRGIVLSLNPATGTVTLVDQFTHTPALIVKSQGNVQALANGDWFLGWGQEPFFSELSPTGALLFDAHFPLHEQSYRSFRFAWTGTPAHPPVFAFQAVAGGGGMVYASWNGATQVASWGVLAGTAPGKLKLVAKVARSGFETAIPLSAATVGPIVEVEALDSNGQLLGTSLAASETGLG